VSGSTQLVGGPAGAGALVPGSAAANARKPASGKIRNSAVKAMAGMSRAIQIGLAAQSLVAATPL